MLEEWLDKNSLVILNDGTKTRYDVDRQSWSAIDLTIATANLAAKMQWQVHDDHLPVITHLCLPPALEEEQIRHPTWNFSKADWWQFRANCLQVRSDDVKGDDPETFCLNLTHGIIYAAKGAIPLTNPVKGKRTVPWWSTEIQKARQRHKEAPTLALLVQLYNLIWENGEVPSTWKHALVVPIPKAGKDSKQANSYRPISLTSNMCKAMEAMVPRRLNHHLETGCHISPHQSGSRKGYSTIDHIVRLEHEIRMAQANRQYLSYLS